MGILVYSLLCVVQDLYHQMSDAGFGGLGGLLLPQASRNTLIVAKTDTTEKSMHSAAEDAVTGLVAEFIRPT